jgi:biopolymer transport protein TolR
MGMSLEVTKAKAGRATPQMNVTPLVDVVLVLLIIFMMITPLLAKQFWLHLPDKVEKEAPPDTANDKTPIVVFVDEQGGIRINSDVVSADEFAHKLTRVLAGSGQRTVFFDAADDAPFEKAVSVMDVARAGGAATIAVLTAPIGAR